MSKYDIKDRICRQLLKISVGTIIYTSLAYREDRKRPRLNYL